MMAFWTNITRALLSHRHTKITINQLDNAFTVFCDMWLYSYLREFLNMIM